MKIGIDLGGSHISIGLVNNENKILKSYEKDFTEEEKKNIKPVIEKYILETVTVIKEKLKKVSFDDEKLKISKIGVAVPGEAKNGAIIKTVNLGINNYNLAEILEEKLKIPVLVRNDGKCACIAEYNNLKHENKDMENKIILFLNIGTGIGGGVIYHNQLLQGNQFEGYEMGHMIIKENGIPCNCGKQGCFEKYGSILQYKNKVKSRLNIPENINGDELRKIMKEHEEEIEDLRQEYIYDLALGISNLINIFEPDVIIIGGGFSHFSYMFVDDLINKLINSNLLFNKRETLDLRIAKLGNDAGIIGATLID